jgi:alginate production protein
MNTFNALRFSAALLALLSSSTWAADEPALTRAFDDEVITSEVFHKLTLQTGYGPQDSTIGNRRESFQSYRYEPSFHWYSPEKRWAQWQVFGRAWINYDTSQASTALQENNPQAGPERERPEYFYSELRELYVRRNLLWDDPRYSVTLGRQSFFDRYGIWWDDTFESVRFNYQDSFTSGFLALGQKFYYYNTDVNDLDDTDEDIFYAMGEYAWRWNPHNSVGVRMLYENDHSDQNPADRQDFTGLRAGLFFDGQNLDLRPLSDYHLELATLDGTVESIDSNSVRDESHSRGWAVLGEVGKRFNDLPWTPRLALRGGITDKPDDANEGFYLNRIQSDRVVELERYSTRLVSSFINVNVRNLKYYGVTLETQPTPRSSLDFRLSDLYLRNDAGDLPLRVDREQSRTRQANIANGSHDGSSSVGQVLDVNYYWKMFPIAHQGKHLDLNTLLSASYFRAGDAVASGDDYQLTLGIVMHY